MSTRSHDRGSKLRGAIFCVKMFREAASRQPETFLPTKVSVDLELFIKVLKLFYVEIVLPFTIGFQYM